MNKLAFLVPVLFSLAAAAQAPKASGPLAKDQGETRSAGPLEVQSPDVKPGATIPSRYTAYADGVSPELYWSQAPKARSYALIVEDPDAPTARPFVHWLAWNIPSPTTRLPEGALPQGAREGRNGEGTTGYFGPKPPPGDPDHHYHFEVFALDTMLDLPPGADRDQVVEAMNGHVVAKGELVATYRGPAG
jgi:Raf kinase inhibitor-like YbhB/YbcL family protein